MTAQHLLFGESHAVHKLLADGARYAPTRHPVLIFGDPGVGKTVLARFIHEQSARDGAFVKESAAAIPEHLEYSHLSGHTRGSFTGATFDRVGLIEAAHRGTFFLDELALASQRVQEILLQLLDDNVVRRVGEARSRPVDVRFIAATNADLGALIAQGRFRRDLRDRFGYLVLRLPSLAERRDEILPLADNFLRLEAALVDAPPRPALSEAVRAAFMAAPWAGNIRELAAVCRYAVLHARAGEAIAMADLPPDFLTTLGSLGEARAARIDAERVRAALLEAHGNKAAAARILGVSRQHFYRLLARDRLAV